MATYPLPDWDQTKIGCGGTKLKLGVEYGDMSPTITIPKTSAECGQSISAI